MSGQGKLTIDPGAATGFMSWTVRSARKHGVMRTVARCAQLLFGHRSHVGALRSRMTRRRENDARRNIGTFPTKRQRKKGDEIERRCTSFRGTASVNAVTTDGYGVYPCREAFEMLEGWQTAGLNALPTEGYGGSNARTAEGYGGKRQAATLEQQMLVARVLGGSCREGF